jgi:phosphate uptake regulator
MKRSIVRHGPSTLTMSLPAKWVKENNLKEGANLDVEEKGSQLVVSTKKGDEFSSFEVDIKDNYKTGLRYISSANRKGCDELILRYSKQSYLKRIERCLSEDVLGYEIVRQGKQFCAIRDIPGTKAEEFDTLLERIWSIIITISEDVLVALSKDDKDALYGITAMDKRVNKFSNFCIRILNKRGHKTYKNIPVLYRFLRGLEEVSDQYKYILMHYSDINTKVDKKYLEFLKKSNGILRSFRKVFYKPKDEDVEKLLKDTLAMFNDVNKYMFVGKEKILIVYLFNINDKIRNLISSVVEMNIVN